MNCQIESLLDQLEDSMSSAALSVADHIRTVAGNGPKYATPEALKYEAEALAEYASQLAKDIELKPKEAKSSNTTTQL